MIQPIMRDQLFLSQKSQPATRMDMQVIVDLKDTLQANSDRCVGLAANMIGASKRILVCAIGPMMLVLVNPEIVSKEGAYETHEGCLSLDGERAAKRYRSIRVRYQDENFHAQERTFMGFPAQIIQHEMDHFEGILI